MTSNQPIPPLFSPPDNHWLRMILAAIKTVLCPVKCTSQESEQSEIEVSPGPPAVLLTANQLSRHVILENVSDVIVNVTEGGVLIAILGAYKTITLPMSGTLEIAAQLNSINPYSTARIKSSRAMRCQCNLPLEVGPIEPMGGYLV